MTTDRKAPSEEIREVVRKEAHDMAFGGINPHQHPEILAVRSVTAALEKWSQPPAPDAGAVERLIEAAEGLRDESYCDNGNGRDPRENCCDSCWAMLSFDAALAAVRASQGKGQP